MTPEVLAAQEGILAVFAGEHVVCGDFVTWSSVRCAVENLATATGANDLSVHAYLSQRAVVIRMMCLHGIDCIVVYRPDGRIMKSLPRSMRRCIEHVRKSMKESST